MRRLIINNQTIDDTTDCYAIAEIGHNHQGKLKTCLEMFKVAKTCGADAVKLQKRDNQSLYTRAAYNKPYDNENSYEATYGEHREAVEFGETPDIGRPKVTSAQEKLRRMNPTVTVIPYHDRLDAGNLQDFFSEYDFYYRRH